MILYFSGTGNCKYVAERIAKEYGEEARSIIGLEPNIWLSQGEMFGLVHPVYWWALPVPVREFYENLRNHSRQLCGGSQTDPDKEKLHVGCGFQHSDAG